MMLTDLFDTHTLTGTLVLSCDVCSMATAMCNTTTVTPFDRALPVFMPSTHK